MKLFDAVIKNENTLIKVQYVMFFLAVLFIPFHEIHKSMRLFILGDMFGKLSIYPIICGMFLWFIQLSSRQKFSLKNPVVMFLLIMLLWEYISLIHGLYIFPFWEKIDVSQFSHMEKIIILFSDFGITLSPLYVTKAWLVIKLLESSFINLFFTFGVSAWGYFLFRNDYMKGIDLFQKGIITGAFICIAYSVIELFYLQGNILAARLLTMVNPLLYDVASIHGWWPPVLFPGRMRSVFAEPSFLALYLAVAIPVFATMMFTKKKKYILSFFFLCFALLATKSKTAFGIFLLQIISFLIGMNKSFKYMKKLIALLLCLILFFAVYVIGMKSIASRAGIYMAEYKVVSIDKNKVVLKITNAGSQTWQQDDNIKVFGIWCKDYDKPVEHAMSMSLPYDIHPKEAFEGTFVFDNPPQGVNGIIVDLVKFENKREFWFASAGSKIFNASIDAEGNISERNNYKNKLGRYIGEMGDVFSLESGSNTSRYGIMMADLKIGMEHPFLGVGDTILKQGYVTDALPQFALESDEVNMWVQLQNKKGILKSQYPVLNELTNQFAQKGIIGVMLFLCPVFYIIRSLFRIYQKTLVTGGEQTYVIRFFFIAFFGVCVGFFSNSANALYTYWLLLGIILSISSYFDKKI
ncbi:O-antigen ligase family protein [Pectinatus haikarae]|uniref:O-antigen ligase family protein n=1 Tax=Pectinatus haikarae TaxID=349096 RepID=UPI0018C83100|nr:O-antigen ligase family protein [Pectinatus haikarae]